MDCPKCGAPMREREKEDIIIDICSSCRGVFLDAGELEKLTMVEDRYYRDRGNRDGRDDRRYDDDDDDDDGLFGAGRGGQRQGGFLSNLFGSFGGND
jgi:Zn-finger nucleic acid-binding protein